MIDPIIPIWLMGILCIFLIILKRRGKAAFIRRVLAALMIFLVNLRIMVPGGQVATTTQTLDTYVLFVVDNTISMLAQDYDGGKERITAVKNDCAEIIENLDGAKFAVIGFNNSASLMSPYTNNSTYAADVINSMYPINSVYAQGSSMNVCKDVMIDTLKRAHDKADGTVVVFFVSDGEITNGDTLESFEKAAKYIDGGAVLGYGTKAGGNMYVDSYISGEKELLEDTSSYPTKPAVSCIDEKNLKSIASDLGVDYINMNDADGEKRISSLAEKIRSGAVTGSGEGSTAKGYIDIYYIFALVFAGLMVWEFIDIKKKYAGGMGFGRKSQEEQR